MSIEQLGSERVSGEPVDKRHRLAIGTQRIEEIQEPQVECLGADDVAQIVHDLKNPLHTIALEASLLDMLAAAGQLRDVRRAIARINGNVAFIDRMVQDLLDLCSIDAGHFTLHRSLTELRTLLEDVIERAVPTPHRARVVLEADAPLTAVIDDLRIQRVVANLLTNALKYGPKHAGIVVRLERCAGACRIAVIDSGGGLGDDELQTMFDKYRRGSSMGEERGHGLGLYVSKRIVEAHGGRIGAEHAHGIGCRFFFELPDA